MTPLEVRSWSGFWPWCGASAPCSWTSSSTRSWRWSTSSRCSRRCGGRSRIRASRGTASSSSSRPASGTSSVRSTCCRKALRSPLGSSPRWWSCWFCWGSWRTSCSASRWSASCSCGGPTGTSRSSCRAVMTPADDADGVVCVRLPVRHSPLASNIIFRCKK